MLKILFSPSEGKNSGGKLQDTQLFGSARDEILNIYKDTILSQDEEKIKSLFGIKKFSDCEQYIDDFKKNLLMPAIQRYNGVAYEYLDFNSLDSEQQKYLEESIIIFSNLYGPLKGSDTIANYKVKQGNNIGEIVPDKYYKERFSYQLDLHLGDHDILDLRAGYYDKFYKTQKPYTTLKFLKDGKSVSHWAKAYRGKVLRELALHTVNSLDEFTALKLGSLEVADIKTTKNKTEIIYNII